MKCPFLVRRKEIFDREGKKIGEEIEIKDCIKNECMVYDGAAKLCSLLSSNIKNGIMIDDFKNGIKEIREEMFQRSEALGVVLSTTVQTLQDSLLNRFDIMKKQNEVIALGFDRLIEIQNSLIGTIKTLSEKNLSQFEILNNTNREQIDLLKTLNESTSNNITNIQNKLSEELKTYFGEMKNIFDGLLENLAQKTEILRGAVEKVSTTYQAGTESINTTIEKSNSAFQEFLKKFEVVENIMNGVNNIAELTKNEIAGLKTETLNTLNILSGKFDEFKSSYSEIVRNQQESYGRLFQEFQNAMGNKLEELRSNLMNFLQNQEVNHQNLFKDLGGMIGFKLDELKVLFNEFSKLQQSSGELISGEFGKIGSNLGQKIDELVNTLKSEFDATLASIQNNFNSFAAPLNEIKGAIDNQLGSIHESVKNFELPLNDLKNSLTTQLSGVQENLKNYEGPVNALKDALNTQLNTIQEALKKYDELNNVLKGGIYNIGEFLNNTSQHYLNSLNNIQTAVSNFEGLFDKTQTGIASMSEMMNNLNRNYLESLSKIAGLAEGMRKGVENVGLNMQDSVKDLIAEMKKEIGGLESQYEKTFGDIARLSEKFSELNLQINRMTNEIQREFKDLLEQQIEISKFSNEVLKNLKDYFAKQEEQYREEQLAKKKKNALDHFDRATLYYYRGNYELALNEIDKALELDKLAEYLNLKGLILTELGREEDAKKSFEEALKFEPNLAEIYNNFGLLYIKTRKLNEAIGMFQEAIKRNANYSLAYVHMGKALLELERYEEAISSFQRALELDPANREAKEAIELYKQGKFNV